MMRSVAYPKRGSIALEHLPDKRPETLRGLSDHDLNRFVAGWKAGTEDHITGTQEIARREREGTERRSLWAFAIACAALVVSVLGLVWNIFGE